MICKSLGTNGYKSPLFHPFRIFDLLNPFLVHVPILYLGFLVFSGGIKWIMFPLNDLNFNPFLINLSILYSLWFSSVFRGGYKMGILVTNELKASENFAFVLNG